MFDPNILAQQSNGNVLASYLGGMEAGQQVTDQQQRNALAQYASQNGSAIMQGDQSALNGLTQFGLQGLELAQNQQGIQLDREAQRLGMDATRQNMDVQRQTQARLDRQEARQIREALQQADAAAIAQEREALEGKLGLMAQAHASGDRAAFEGLVQQFGFDQDPNDNITYDNFLAKAGEFRDVLEIYGEVAAEKSATDSAAEQKIARIMESGVDRETAVNIVDGVIVTSRDPITGEVVLINKADMSAPAAPAAPQPSVAVPQPSPQPELSFSDDIPTGGQQAFGLEGVVKGGINNVSDFVTGREVFPEVAEQQRFFMNMEEDLLVGLSQAYGRQPAQRLMERLRSLVPQTTDGSARALGEIEQLENRFQRDLRSVENTLNRKNRPADLAAAQQRREGLESVLALLSEAKTRIQGPTQSGGNTTSSGVTWEIVE